MEALREILSTPVSLIDLLKSKDLATDAHSRRVSALTSEWIQHMKSRAEWIDLEEQDLVLAARLHDVGKVGVLNRVLQKEGPLTELERAHLNQHAEIGYELVRDIDTTLALAVKHHHERWDGNGYPSKLAGDAIPFFAQVICIVDSFDAMTSDRPYQKARSEAQAVIELENNAGHQFSPILVESFVKFLNARRT
jgi:HD-GYP domain-containing protein (c-di-GMP phosphodiesterase class II)